MADCGGFDPAGPFVGGVLAAVDCRALGMAQDGWRAFGGGPWLTAALTIAVALMGYRLLLGQAQARDGMMLALRMGVALALITQWPAWEAVAYRVGIEGPESIAVTILGGDGARGALAARYDRLAADIDEALRIDGMQVAENKVQPGGKVLSSEAREQLARAQRWMTGAALGGLLAPRLMVALLLGVGPLFVGGLLFSGAQGLFIGWLRVLVGAMVAAVAALMVLGFELDVAGPQVALLLQDPGGNGADAVAARLVTTAGMFAALMVVVSLAVMRAAWSIRIPVAMQASQNIRRATSSRETLASRVSHSSASSVQQFAQSMTRSMNREVMMSRLNSEKTVERIAPTPLGQSGGTAARRMQRQTGAAQKRDGAV